MPNHHYIDLHCHPAMKPFGKSFGTANPKENTTDKSKSRSIWFYDHASLSERVQSDLGGFPPFTQCDFSSLAYGDATVIGIALYPLEKRFVQHKRSGDGVWENPSDLRAILLEGITGIGGERIQHIQQLQDYFGDMCSEYKYYESLHDQTVTLAGMKATYRLAKNYADVQANILANQNRNAGDPLIITLFVTIEGGHVFNTASYVNTPFQLPEIKTMISAIKNWDAPPFFLTLCHHYYNGLCGHARSLNSMVAGKSPQEDGINSGFTDLGWGVVNALLTPENNKRIYIDIKHMSPAARQEYYAHIAAFTGSNKVPVIVSHGAVNGLSSFASQFKTRWLDRDVFLNWPINFYDDEIKIIAESGGIFGIQMDERRIASDAAIKNARGVLQSRATIRKKRSEFFWNQIVYIAELLDSHGLFGWGIQSIGSDNDGIINPINGFETAEAFETLEQCLLDHATEYMTHQAPTRLTSNGNRSVTPDEIINRVMRNNANDFLSRWFW